jgi:hypothetical protein
MASCPNKSGNFAEIHILVASCNISSPDTAVLHNRIVRQIFQHLQHMTIDL